MTPATRRLAMFPLSVVLFPHAPLPLRIFEPRYRAMTTDCLEGDGEFGVVLISRGSEVGGGEQRTAVGTVARIVQAAPQPDGGFLLLAVGTERIRVTEWLPDDPYPLAEVEEVATGAPPPPELVQATTSAVRRTRALLSELGQAPALAHDFDAADDPDEVLWRLCAAAPCNALDAQQVLSIDDPTARLTLLGELCVALGDDLSRMLAEGSDD